jgi:hypothetical protein
VEETEDGVAFRAIGCEALDELGAVEPAANAFEVVSQGGEGVDGLGLSNDVEVAAFGEEVGAEGERFEVAGEAGLSAADALSDGVYLAAVGGVEGDDFVGFAELALAEDDGLGFVDAGSGHRGMSVASRLRLETRS